MKRIIRLTESDLTRIVRRVISEQKETVEDYDKDFLKKKLTIAKNILKDIFDRTYDESIDGSDKVKSLCFRLIGDFFSKITDKTYKIRDTGLTEADIIKRLTRRGGRDTELDISGVNVVTEFIKNLNEKHLVPDDSFVSLIKYQILTETKNFIKDIESAKTKLVNNITLQTKPAKYLETNKEPQNVKGTSALDYYFNKK